MTEIKANEEYTVGFMSDKRQMLLNVLLGANFPNEKPKIIITPRIQHEWISDQTTGEIQNAPGLLNVNFFFLNSYLDRFNVNWLVDSTCFVFIFYQ